MIYRVLAVALPIALLASGIARAAEVNPKFVHDATAEEIRQALVSNQNYHLNHPMGQKSSRPFRPVEDTANFAYVLMSGYEEDSDEVANLRETIARNLPEGVKLVILADAADAAAIKDKYLNWISADRLIVATDTFTENGFWARDSFPIPVYDNDQRSASLVAAHYYRDFTAWDAVANGVGAPIAKKDFTFVDGNILSDTDGNCFSVNSYRLFSVTQDDLMQSYGCKVSHLMTHVRGLGDVDEVLKPLPGGKILTNSPEYKSDLEAWGYQVTMLPTLPETYRTYVNALVVRNVVFMPTYGVAEDAIAQKVYEDVGYHVVPIRTNQLSDGMHGSIHCQTMAYPAMPKGELLKALHLQEYR